MSGRPPVLCLGVGNEHRRDDGIGPQVVRAVATRPMANVRCAVEPGEVGRLMAAWEGVAALVIVDAVASAGEPGRLLHIDPLRDGPAFVSGDPSSHGLGVGEALRLSHALGTLPARVDLFLVNGADFGHGEGLSPPLRARLPDYVATLARHLDRLATGEVLTNA